MQHSVSDPLVLSLETSIRDLKCTNYKSKDSLTKTLDHCFCPQRFCVDST